MSTKFWIKFFFFLFLTPTIATITFLYIEPIVSAHVVQYEIANNSQYSDVDETRKQVLENSLMPEDICQQPNQSKELIRRCGVYYNTPSYLLFPAALLLGVSALSILITLLFFYLAKKSSTHALLIMRIGFVLTKIECIFITLISAFTGLLVGINIFINFNVSSFEVLGAFFGFSAFMTIRIFLSLTKIVNLPCQLLSKEEAPALWESVIELAHKINMSSPDNIAVGSSLLPFFSTNSDKNIFVANKRMAGSFLYIPLPLFRILSKNELETLIALEMSSQTNDQNQQITNRYISLCLQTKQITATLDKFMLNIILFLFPFYLMKFYYLLLESIALPKIAEQTLLIDQQVANIFTAKNLAKTLYKYALYHYACIEVARKIPQSNNTKISLTNLSEIVSSTYDNLPLGYKKDSIGEITSAGGQVTALSKRLSALDISIESLSTMKTSIPDSECASILLTNPKSLEASTTERGTPESMRDK